MVIRFLSGTPALNLCLCSAFRLSYTETYDDMITIRPAGLEIRLPGSYLRTLLHEQMLHSNLVNNTDLRAAHQLDDPPAADALAGLCQSPLTPDGPRRGRRAVHEVGR